jgi:UDP-glucuronate 4-epimerase
MKNQKVLITGGAGFIGSTLVDSFLRDGAEVTVIDNFDPFYDSAVKRANLFGASKSPLFRLLNLDIRDLDALRASASGEYQVIVHLAAKAGVRPSIKDPVSYYGVNVGGTQNMLEVAREWGVPQFVFASSSSVYGVNPNVPWREDDHVLQPISPYASTKVSGELLGHVYSHLFGLRFIALRFFTVFGPRQRPDLAIHKFAEHISSGIPIPFYGTGESRRDYTFVDDIVAGIRAAVGYTGSMYEVFNLGNNRTISLNELVNAIEDIVGVRAILDKQPDQPGDVTQTWASISKAGELLGYAPRTELYSGLRRFMEWQSQQPVLKALALNPGLDQPEESLHQVLSEVALPG